MDSTRPIRILLALDGSPHANRAAQYVAQRVIPFVKCEVTVVHAVQGPPLPYAVSPEADPTVTAIRLQMQEYGVPTDLRIVPGRAAYEIARIAREDNYDEIVLGSRGANAVEQLALGSVAYKVAHLASQPVTIVPNPYGHAELDLEDDPPTHRILLASDGSAAALRAAEYVSGLAPRMPLSVHLLNVQHPIVSRQISRYVSKAAIEAFQQEEGKEALAPAAEALRKANVKTEALVHVGQVARTIVREAVLLGCTRIVLGSRGYGALGGLVLGSTALQVMHVSELPVTLIK